ncbi:MULTISPECIES: GNAT family N-acetyltransferase [Microbacterium]|uniref:GNAT family N-acetyltransferase n=1 Tax=Microbacterium TaxID=33882 RepID=UPI0028E74D98|nr:MULTISPECIES: GNAT family N-acetyltransferase [Microbacterium]
MRPLIRFATAADHVVLEELERAADLILIERFGARSWPPPTSNEERQDAPGFVLVAALPSPADEQADHPSTPVGFAHVLEVDGEAHLEQLSVRPEHARRGVGRALVVAAQEEARRRGHRRLTLRTYADVPWNAPFYARCGFEESAPDTDFLRALVGVEERLNLSVHGRRIQMTATL